MIPKIIHYCWFGKGLMPKSQRDCIKGWQKIMPDYKIMRWDESNFDINICEYSTEAYKAKKYAYVSDIARCKALYEYGGIYLDTDVEVFKPFDDFLGNDFFSAIEIYNEFYTENIASMLDENGNPLVKGAKIPHIEILTSIMGASRGCSLIKDIFDYYINIDNKNKDSFFSIDRLVPSLAAQYGFRYIDKTQHLDDNMVIYGTGTFGYAFCPNPDYIVSYHHNAASWKDNKTRSQAVALQFDKLGLLPLYKKCKAIGKKAKSLILGK